jgi:hypothetical protein
MAEFRHRSIPAIVQFLSVAGAAAMAIGALTSYVTATGATPSWLYERYRWLPYLTDRQRWADVPIEFFGIAAFASLASICWWARRRTSVPWPQWTFLLSATIIGVAGQILIASRVTPLPLLVSVGLAVVTLIVASSQPLRLREMIRTDGPATLKALFLEPSPRAFFLTFCCVTVMGAQVLHARLERVSTDHARARAFVNWFSAQRPPQDGALRSDTKLQVVVFTDYECPFSATQVPEIEATIRRVQAKVRPTIELVVRDFPLEAECNAMALKINHPVACEAAAAIRLVVAERGAAAGRDLAKRFYQVSGQLSPVLISSHLARLNLEAEFTRRYPALVQEIAAETREAQSMGITGTPTIFVNGIKLRDGASMVGLALEHEATRW